MTTPAKRPRGRPAKIEPDAAQVAVRLSTEDLARLDAYVATLQARNPDVTVTRADALRVMLRALPAAGR